MNHPHSKRLVAANQRTSPFHSNRRFEIYPPPLKSRTSLYHAANQKSALLQAAIQRIHLTHSNQRFDTIGFKLRVETENQLALGPEKKSMSSLLRRGYFFCGWIWFSHA